MGGVDSPLNVALVQVPVGFAGFEPSIIQIFDVVAVTIAQVFSGVWSGVQTAANGLAAAADIALNFSCYTITLTYLAAAPTPAAAAHPRVSTHYQRKLVQPFDSEDVLQRRRGQQEIPRRTSHGKLTCCRRSRSD